MLRSDVPFEDIKSAHFTICQKPWECGAARSRPEENCKQLHRRWFQVLNSVEERHKFPADKRRVL